MDSGSFQDHGQWHCSDPWRVAVCRAWAVLVLRIMGSGIVQNHGSGTIQPDLLLPLSPVPIFNQRSCLVFPDQERLHTTRCALKRSADAPETLAQVSFLFFFLLLKNLQSVANIQSRVYGAFQQKQQSKHDGQTATDFDCPFIIQFYHG